MKPSAENLGSAEPQDLLFFLHGLPSSAVAARGRPWPPCCSGDLLCLLSESPVSRACAFHKTWPGESHPDATQPCSASRTP